MATRLPIGVTVNTGVTTRIPPNQVTGVAVTGASTTKTSITLTWSTGTVASGGPAITRYRVYNSGALVATVNAPTTTATISGLTAGTTYSFTVSAVNPDGEGAQSAPVSATTTSGGGLPGAPTGLNAYTGINRMLDPSLEGAVNVWGNTSDATKFPVTADNAVVYTGQVSQRTTRTATSPSTTIGAIYTGQSGHTTPGRIVVTAGGTVSGSAKIRTVVSANGQLSFTFLNDSDAVTGTSFGSVDALTAGVWNTLKLENITVPTGSTYVLVAVNAFTADLVTPAVTGTQMWVDAVMFNTGTTALPYFDGNTVGCSWNGTPNASTSTASVTASTIPLSWTPGTPDATDATLGFRVYAAGNPTPVATTTGAGATSVTVTGLVRNTTYSLTVRGYNANGESNPSTAITVTTLAAVPNQVTGLTVVNTTQTVVNLSWTPATVPAGASPITAYYVYRNNVQVATVTQVNVIPLGTAVTGLTPNTTYSFQVAAVNTDGTGTRSTAVSATTAAVTGSVPGAPSGLTSSNVTQTSVTLSWTAGTPDSINPTQGYRVYRSGATVLGTFTATTGTLVNLTPATTYSLSVVAYNAIGESTASNVVSVTTSSSPPPPPPGSGKFRSGSWWEKKLPSNPPQHPNNATILNTLSNNTFTFVGGANDANAGLSTFQPGLYKVKSTDTIYHVNNVSGHYCPPEWLASGPGLRIPEVAKKYYGAGGANDAPMLIYSPPGVGPGTAGARGYYAWFAMLLWNGSQWQLNGIGAQGSVWYLDTYGMAWSNKGGDMTGNHGIEGGQIWPDPLPGSGRSPAFYHDDDSNGGFRGFNAMCRCIDYDRVKSENAVNYVMELFAANAGSPGHWPMTGAESGSGAVQEGTRLRIKPSVDVAARMTAKLGAGHAGLQEAIAINKGLQDYGIVAADNSGSGHHVKLSSPAKDGRGNIWKVPHDALIQFNTTDWMVVADSYDPP